MTAIEWLQSWYFAQCDGDWEHQLGLKIETLDNPGWKLTIDLTGTDQVELPFARVWREGSEHDWIHCEVKGQRFLAACGPLNLIEAVEVFRAWAESASSRAE